MYSPGSAIAGTGGRGGRAQKQGKGQRLNLGDLIVLKASQKTCLQNSPKTTGNNEEKLAVDRERRRRQEQQRTGEQLPVYTRTAPVWGLKRKKKLSTLKKKILMVLHTLHESVPHTNIHTRTYILYKYIYMIPRW
jgi:hypothetical protein